MKQLFLLFLVFGSLTVQAQVGLGTNTPDPNSILDLTSNNKGLLIPRMLTSDRLAITSPPNGLIVYDVDTNGICYFSSTLDWVCIDAESANGWVQSVDGTTPASDATQSIERSGDLEITTTSFQISISESGGIILKNTASNASIELGNDGKIKMTGSSGSVLFIN